MKKIFSLLCVFGMLSFTFASEKFTPTESKQIDQQAQDYLKKGVNAELIQQLKKQESILREVRNTINYASKSGFIGYGVAKYPTPVLWYPIWFPTLDKSFGASPYTGLNLDSYQQIDELDFVAFTGTVFTIIAKVQTGGYTFYQVRNREFGTTSADQGYYIDSRFVDVKKAKPIERKVELPSLHEIYERLLIASGTLYVRGGTYPEGIEKLNEFFPSSRQTGTIQQQKKIIKGVDCSGLLYRATKGYTPRNTSELVMFGTGLAIKGLTAEQIVAMVKPLDIITWAGHVMIILNKSLVIESRRLPNETGGTRIRTLKDVLKETMAAKTAANEYYGDPKIDGKKNFVIRRWFNGK